MKKCLISFVLILFLCSNAFALKTIELIPATSTGGDQTTTEVELKGAAQAQKILFFECLGTGASIVFQVQSGMEIGASSVWATTDEFTLSESGGTWTLTRSSGATTLDSMPFYLVTNNYMDLLRIQYNISAGSINSVALVTSQ